MATYSTDLTDIVTCETGDTFLEMTGYALGDVAVVDADLFIQGAACATNEANAKTGVGHSNGYDYGSQITFATDDCCFMWMQCTAGNAMDTFANGGYRMLIGSSIGDYNGWIIGGSDFGRNPYGGWINAVVDPTFTADYTLGTSTGYQFFAAAWNLLNSISKGRPLCLDATRYGRGDLSIIGTGATFALTAAANDAISARWGLFQAEGIGYLWKGLLSLGTSAASITMSVSNVNITIDDTPRTYAAFNKIEINNTGSSVTWTSVNITAANASGLSKGMFEMIDNVGTVDMTGCVFTDMSTFIFQSNAALDTVTFRRCGQITQGGADFDDCLITNSTAAVSMVVSDLNALTGNTFESDGSNHAVNLGTISTTQSLTWNNTLVDYAATNGSTGNEAILVSVDTGITLTINVSGGTTPTYYNTGAGTVTVVSSFDHTITGLELNTEVTYVTSGTTTELYHVEQATVSDGDGKYKITYSHGGGASVDVLIHHKDYKPDISNIYGITLPSAASFVKVKMFPDENYENIFTIGTPTLFYDGVLRALPTDTYRLLDFGRQADNGLIYSGQMLNFDGVDDNVDIGDISASCKSFEITIDPVTTTEGIIQLASGVSISISSGTISTSGLSNVTTYVNGAIGTTVAVELTVLAVTFDAISCSDVVLGYDGTIYFDGKQGNIKLWSETLSSDDVSYSYAWPELTADNRTGTSLTSSNLKAHYPLFEGSGDTAYDHSGNNKHGVLKNFSTDDSQWITGISDKHVMQTVYMPFGSGNNDLLHSNDIDQSTSNWSAPYISGTGGVVENSDGTITCSITSGGVGRAYSLHTANISLDASTDYTLSYKVDSITGIPTTATLTIVPGGTTSGTLSLITTSAGFHECTFQTDTATTTAHLRLGLGVSEDEPAGTKSITISHIQLEKTSSRSAAVITNAVASENTLVPLVSTDARQFTRDNNGLNFNGRSYVTCGDNIDVNPTNVVIIETVFCYHSAPSDAYGYIVNDSTNNIRLYPYYDDRLYFTVRLADGVYYNIGILDNSIKLVEGQMYHIVVGYSKASESMYGYLDGVSNVFSTNLPVTWQDFYSTTAIRNINASDYPLVNQLPMFKMYTDAEAQRIIDSGIASWVSDRYAEAQTNYGVS